MYIFTPIISWTSKPMYAIWRPIHSLRNLQVTLSTGRVMGISIAIVISIIVGIYLDAEHNESGILQWLRTTQQGTATLQFESGSTTIRNVGLAIAAAVALTIAIWRGQVAEKQAEIARQDLLNERYQKGAEMLGSKVLAVRLAGIYALQRLAEEDRQQYHLKVMRSLCAFAQYPTEDKHLKAGIYWDDEGDHHYHPLRGDVQAVMQILGDRDEDVVTFEKESDFKIDLTKANLTGGDLKGLNLSYAVLVSANISGSDLRFADLREARLTSAVLDRAELQGAKLQGTRFLSTNLSDAIFAGASPNDYRRQISACGLTQGALNYAFIEPGKFPRFGNILDPITGCPLKVDRVTHFPED